MKLTILSPGLLSTIQDAGRFGAMGKGFSPGGAMDMEAMTRANLLVGNAPGIGVMEMTMLGITARFDCDCVIALTGADMDGFPSSGQLFQSMSVAVFSGVIATLLFFEATNLVKHNPKQLAVIEATQAGEVLFTLLGGILFLHDSLPTASGILGICVVVIGMILNSLPTL